MSFLLFILLRLMLASDLRDAFAERRLGRPNAASTRQTRHMRFAILFALVSVCTLAAADRQWQTGKWIDVSVKRRMVDFGPGASPFGSGAGRPSAPSMRAEADVKLYVIETDTLRLELEDVVKVNTRSLDAVIGLPVTFALEKNSVYVKDSTGVEHKLRVTKKTSKPA